MAIVLDGTSGIDSPAINAGNIVGQVCFFGMTTAPSGFLKCNGAAVSRSTYADLFAAIGTTYGAGNGSTTFNLPDLRGEFLRGWDDGRGVDSGRAFGSAQADAFKSHNHELFQIGNINTPFNTTAGGTGVAATVGSTGASGGSETRPRNVALLACIKF